MAWSYINTLEWVLYRDLMISKSYDDEILAGGDPTSVSRLSLMPGFEDDDLLRIPYYDSLREAEASILQKARQGELTVHGTPLVAPSQQSIPAREFHNASITEEIIPPNKVEHRLLPKQRRLGQWSELLFDPGQVKAIWPSVEHNSKGAGRREHPAKHYAMFWLSSLLASSNSPDWLSGKQKQEIRNLLVSRIKNLNERCESPLSMPKPSTLDSWIDEWLSVNPQARKRIGRKWAKR